eukprot:SAG31_NODE_8671_length_1410_cov_1.205187_1_plen_20_part_10
MLSWLIQEDNVSIKSCGFHL